MQIGWFVPEELSYCDTKFCKYFLRKRLFLPKCSVYGIAVKHERASRVWDLKSESRVLNQKGLTLFID